MTAKEYLEQVKEIDSKINRLASQKERLKECMYSSPGLQTEERVQTSRNIDKLGSLYARIDDIEREINERKAEMALLRVEIALKIDDLLDFTQKQILRSRYVHLKSWEDISAEIEYSKAYTFTLHKKAMQEFEKIYCQTDKVQKVS